MTTYYKATDSKGRVHTRTTRDRKYTHAVVRESAWNPGKAYSSWAGRLDLAQKQAQNGGEIIEAVEINPQEYRAIKAGTA